MLIIVERFLVFIRFHFTLIIDLATAILHLIEINNGGKNICSTKASAAAVAAAAALAVKKDHLCNRKKKLSHLNRPAPAVIHPNRQKPMTFFPFPLYYTGVNSARIKRPMKKQ